MARRKSGRVVVFYTVITLLAYLNLFISPAFFWPIGLANYFVPLLIVFQAFLLVWVLFRRPRYYWLPLSCLILGYYFIHISYKIPGERSSESDLQVLSFNARFFGEWHDNSKFSPATIAWAIADSAQIKCFQEFSHNPYNDEFNVLDKMVEAGYSHYSFSAELDSVGGHTGLATFSRYPIINEGFIRLNDNNYNNCIFSDIVVNDDTVRIYNFHLKSMGIRLYEFRRPGDLGRVYRTTITKLGTDSSKRSDELDQLIGHMKKCPYRFIVACDFNEMIYGNNYFKFKKVARNAFEVGGSGLGFTYNGWLFFLRIDHQFFSPGLEAVNFEVIDKIRSSDHLPVKGYYRFDTANAKGNLSKRRR